MSSIEGVDEVGRECGSLSTRVDFGGYRRIGYKDSLEGSCDLRKELSGRPLDQSGHRSTYLSLSWLSVRLYHRES